MLISAQNSNKVNCKIQDCFANRQIKEDVKCNTKEEYKYIKIMLILLFIYLNFISFIASSQQIESPKYNNIFIITSILSCVATGTNIYKIIHNNLCC
jgi:hypothetical protein